MNQLLLANGILQLGHTACFIDHVLIHDRWKICLQDNSESQYGSKQIEHGYSFFNDLSSVISKTWIASDWKASKTLLCENFLYRQIRIISIIIANIPALIPAPIATGVISSSYETFEGYSIGVITSCWLVSCWFVSCLLVC